jgi:hypothetical protein
MPLAWIPGQIPARPVTENPFGSDHLTPLAQSEMGRGIRLGPVAIPMDPPVATNTLTGGYFQSGTRSWNVQLIPNPTTATHRSIPENQQPLAKRGPLLISREGQIHPAVTVEIPGDDIAAILRHGEALDPSVFNK